MAEKKHDPDSIREVNVFVDDAGRRVNEFVQVYGKTRDPKFYKGEAIIAIKHPNPDVPAQHVKLEFLLDEAGNLQEAFAQFDRVAGVERDRWGKEQKEAAVKHASQKGKKGNIVTLGKRLLNSNGRPIG